VISKGKPIVLCDIGRWSRQRNQIIKYDIWYLDTTPAAVCKDPVTLFIQTATDGNWWQLMATDGNITDPQYRKQYRWEINYAGLHQPSQCQVHSKSADTINTVRLTGTGLDTKLSYTIYDDRIIPTLFTHWQMCKDNTSIAHTLTDVQINSIGDSPVLPIPRWLSEWKLLDEKACGIRTAQQRPNLYAILPLITHTNLYLPWYKIIYVTWIVTVYTSCSWYLVYTLVCSTVPDTGY
jgi:hypothetical protein